MIEREVGMQFGLELNWRSFEGISVGDAGCLDGIIRQICLGETLGFTSAWPFERDAVRADVPASWPPELMSMISSATRTIRIGHRLWPTGRGVGGPLRAADRAAALDLLCDGRLEIDCTASTSGDTEPGAIERALRSVLDAWTNPGLKRAGAFFSLADRATMVRPRQHPHPPMWMSVKDTSSWDLAGRLGVGVVVSAPPDTALQSRIDAYRHADRGRVASTASGREIAVRTIAICSATGEDAFIGHQAVRWPRRRTPLGAATRRSGSNPVTRSDLPIGDAAQCVKVAKAYEKVGVSRLLCQFPSRGGNHTATTEAMTRFGDDVIAAFT